MYIFTHILNTGNASWEVSRVAFSNSSRTDLPNKDRNSNFVFLDESNNNLFNFCLFSLIDFALCTEYVFDIKSYFYYFI